MYYHCSKTILMLQLFLQYKLYFIRHLLLMRRLNHYL